MFRRPDDPDTHYKYYGFPIAGTALGYGVAHSLGFGEIDSVMGTMSGLLCIGGIAGLSSQDTARLGLLSGQTGVCLALASTTSWDVHTLSTTIPLLATGLGGGVALASQVSPTSLPQTVAAFHSLVGVAKNRNINWHVSFKSRHGSG